MWSRPSLVGEGDAVYFEGANLSFVPIGEAQGEGPFLIARVIDERSCPSLGAGVCRLRRCRLDWTVRYDEVIYVVEGRLSIHHAGSERVGQPGDLFLLRKGASVSYEAEDGEATFFYALYPVNWRVREGG